MYHSNDQIGPYKLHHPLGEGQYGEVWLAQKSTGITPYVAIKIPKRTVGVDIGALKKEASLWVQANGHPNVLPVIEAEEYDGEFIIVSEFAAGGTLSGWLEKNNKRAPSVEAAVEMICGILSGLAYLHDRNIIHRDLKPGNILLQQNHPRITDFGVSRSLSTSDQSMVVRGTPLYMAPEAWQGERSRETDLWSVGVIFFEMLSGYRPFESENPMNVCYKVHSEEPSFPPGMPAELKRIIGRALKKTSQQRYQSAHEMLDNIRTAVQKQTAKNTKSIKDRVDEIKQILRETAGSFFVEAGLMSDSDKGIVEKCQIPKSFSLLGYIDVRGWFLWSSTNRFVAFSDSGAHFYYKGRIKYIKYEEFTEKEFTSKFHRESNGRNVSYWYEIFYGKDLLMIAGEPARVEALMRMLNVLSIFIKNSV